MTKKSLHEKMLYWLKERYAEGLDWMCLGDGFAQIMYIACIITEFLILYKLNPGNVKEYIMLFGINYIVVYFFSTRKNSVTKTVVFWMVEVMLAMGISSSTPIPIAFAIFLIPIIIAYLIIFLDETTGIMWWIGDILSVVRAINPICAVIIAGVLPTIIIAIPLIFGEWSIRAKITIILGTILCSPLIAYGDASDLNIFSAMSFEW